MHFLFRVNTIFQNLLLEFLPSSTVVYRKWDGVTAEVCPARFSEFLREAQLLLFFFLTLCQARFPSHFLLPFSFSHLPATQLFSHHAPGLHSASQLNSKEQHGSILFFSFSFPFSSREQWPNMERECFGFAFLLKTNKNHAWASVWVCS